ncbi:MAG: extracellular solute-binding protein [Oscillospiraceae bacterium]|nr:extracellular solute-binding protein [Clostridia bacterium]MBR3240003.1 extracellular solute-binding protein [Oscillospiraceae bacterium]
MRKISMILALCLCLAMLASAALADGYTFPLEKTESFTALTNYPVGTESDPNNRTIFKRLEEATNVHVEWRTIQSDQWGDKITLEMSNAKTLPELVFNAGFGDTDLQKYAKQGAIIALEDYIDSCMPNLQKVFEQAPEYRVMCTDENGHIWALPWIEQLGYEKTAIQTVGSSMPFINKGWLDFLGLEVPTTVDDFEAALIAFRDNADKLAAEFGIEGSIIPMSFIMNDQDPYLLINGFGEGVGDVDIGRHIAVNSDKQVICSATLEGFKKGTEWMHKLYEEGLIDPEAFTQEWSTYVAKGKSGRYGVCFSWDVANIAQVSMDDLIAGKSWVPLPALTADVRNITPQNGSYTSGFDRGRCVVTALCKNPELVCSWLDLMYDPMQSPQNNWGTYGEDDEFDIFEMSTNDAGEPMLKHTWLGDASPVEVREAESVNGPLAILDSYYGKYVTLPDDAAYRLNWIKDIYTPDMNTEYVYPNVFMNAEDNKECSNLSADITKRINTAKSDWVMNGFTDADWEQFQNDLKAYGLDKYLEIHQKYLDAYFAG